MTGVVRSDGPMEEAARWDDFNKRKHLGNTLILTFLFTYPVGVVLLMLGGDTVSYPLLATQGTLLALSLKWAALCCFFASLGVVAKALLNLRLPLYGRPGIEVPTSQEEVNAVKVAFLSLYLFPLFPMPLFLMLIVRGPDFDPFWLLVVALIGSSATAVLGAVYGHHASVMEHARISR